MTCARWQTGTSCRLTEALPRVAATVVERDGAGGHAMGMGMERAGRVMARSSVPSPTARAVSVAWGNVGRASGSTPRSRSAREPGDQSITTVIDLDAAATRISVSSSAARSAYPVRPLLHEPRQRQASDLAEVMARRLSCGPDDSARSAIRAVRSRIARLLE